MSKYDAIPANACMMGASIAHLGDNGDNSKTAPVTLLARSSKAIEHPYWGNIAHDISGFNLNGRTRLPIDFDHDTGEAIGYINKFDQTPDGLVLFCALISTRDGDRASKIIEQSRAGIPYEASINFGGDGIEVEEVPVGKTAMVNGYELSGESVIVRKWPLRGVAVTLYGADVNTSTKVFNEAATVAAKVLTTTEEVTAMGDKCPLAPAKEFGANLGRLLERLRDENDKTNDDLGNAGGISASTVSDIITGEINCPPIERLRGFAQELGVSVDSLVSAAEEDGCTYGEQEEMSAETKKEEFTQAVEEEVAEAVEAVEAVEAEAEQVEEVHFSQSDFVKIVTDFGQDIAVQVATNGGNYDDAKELHQAAKDAELVALRAEVAELKAQKPVASGASPVAFADGEKRKPTPKKLRNASFTAQ